MPDDDQVEKKPRKGGGAPRHDKNSGLVQYADGLWGLDCFLHGKRLRKKVGKLSEARQLRDDLKAAERRGEVVAPQKKVQKRTLAEWIGERDPEHPEKCAKDAYLAVNRGTTNEFFIGVWRDSIGRLYPEQFTLEALRAWAHERLRLGAEVASVKRSMDPLRAVYAEIQRRGFINEFQNPFRDPKALRLPKINNKRPDNYLPREKAVDLRETFGEFWWPYAEFAIATMMRFSEQAGLRWDAIDWTSCLANLRRTKNGMAHQTRLSAVALALLRIQRERQLASGKPSEWCWPSEKGGQLHKDNFRHRVWGPAFAKAGLKELGKGCNGLTWHGMGRHTGITWLLQDGEDMYVVQACANHEDFRTTERYGAHAKDRIRKAMERLGEITREALEDPSRGSNAAVRKKSGANESPGESMENPVRVRFSSN